MTVAYDSDPPGVAGVHYGGDGIGIDGSRVPLTGTDAQSVIASSLSAPPVPGIEYRLYSASIPAGVTINENGSGDFDGTARQVVVTFTLYANGIEVP